MEYKCGNCLLFEGFPKCGAGRSTSSSNGMATSCISFKAPSSFFKSKRCGGCRLFEGNLYPCGAGRHTSSQNGMAESCNSYALIPG